MPQKPLPSADNRFSKENYRAEDVWELSSCKMANYRSVLPCAAASYIEELFADHSL